MSIILKSDEYIFISHKEYIDKLYKNTQLSVENTVCYELNESLFKRQNKKQNANRKRSWKCDQIQVEALNIKEILNKCKADITSGKLYVTNNIQEEDASIVRELSKNLFEATAFDHVGLSGGNTADTPLICNIKDQEFLIPSQSRFICGCVKEKTAKLKDDRFDVLIADPPWWNKYIRRLKSANEKLSYSMMYNEDIASIPIKDILSENCLVAVWCTNAPSNIEAVTNTIFPQWGVTYLATWYWLKVTVDLEPVCPFSSGSKKQPYERIILGKIGDVEVPKSLVIVSVPSALHSHKPPLIDVLKPYIKEESPKILELFARYLLPNTTSVGYEPLKWQHLSLYEKLIDNK